MRTARVVVVLLLSLSAVACKRRLADSGPPDPSEPAEVATGKGGPLAIEWVKDEKFQVKGSPKQYADVGIFRGTYQVTIYGFPKQTKWSALDKKGVIDSDIYSILKIADMSDKLGDVPADPEKQRDAKLDPGATLALELPNGATASIKLPPSGLGLSVDEALKKIENGPVLFGNEPPGGKPMESILYANGFSSPLFGRATKLRDVYALAKATLLPDVKGTKKCTGYKGKDDKPTSDLELSLKETEVVIYERRTGNVLQKKTFPPDTGCPMFTFRRADETTHDSSIPTQAIEAWLRTQIRR